MNYKTPDWVKHAVFYQIFPDRFAKSTQNQPGLSRFNRLHPWESEPAIYGYKGGDLWGIVDKIDYLQDLGINAIYFTPIFQSASNHRYHTHDYYQVDPMLGGNRALQALLTVAHERNIKIVLDGVFNHASRGFYYFNDILENGADSAWLDWFQIEDLPLYAYDESKPANYVSWANIRALPKFNHDNPEVREYLMQVGEFWLKQGIDGWRLDVPSEIEAEGFWQEFRSRVKAINPDAYIVGEIWTDARQWLDGTQFDAVMNYMFTGPTIAFTAGDRVIRKLVESPSYEPYPPLSAQGYRQKIEDLLALYPWEIQLAQLNLLDIHDTARLITIAGGDKASVELATLLLLTFPGAPSIYYGDEVGLEGGLDPDSRRGFPFEKSWDLTVLNYHKKLIALRHQYPALRTGEYRVLYAIEFVYVFARILDEETVIVAVNVDTAPVVVQFPVTNLNSRPDRFLYGEGRISWKVEEDSSQLELSLLPRSGAIISIR